MFDHQMVIKYLDGSIMKGFGSFIGPGEMVAEVQDLLNDIHFVDLSKVKAVFYVRSLEGLNVHRSGSRRQTRTFASGEQVRAVFEDGEEITGLMTNPDSVKTAKGFYVTPTEEGSNNYRIYANRAAIKEVFVTRYGREINLLL